MTYPHSLPDYTRCPWITLGKKIPEALILLGFPVVFGLLWMLSWCREGD